MRRVISELWHAVRPPHSCKVTDDGCWSGGTAKEESISANLGDEIIEKDKKTKKRF